MAAQETACQTSAALCAITVISFCHTRLSNVVSIAVCVDSEGFFVFIIYIPADRLYLDSIQMMEIQLSFSLCSFLLHRAASSEREENTDLPENES